MSKTLDDLHNAFAGESQAFQKYTNFAKKAAAQGFPNVAKLFETTAQAEHIHASGHMKAMEMIKDTVDNLQAAIDGETYEYTEMYPPMVEEATKENHAAKVMFGFAVKAEEVHAAIYKKALEAVKEGKDLDISEFYLCPVCGYIELGERPESCPVCHAKGEKFVLYSAK
ncbi:MAG: rubrerythrin family protein [Anaerolineaceae bacterium]|nr:rubrerythrin family protein [Anaerolineaceae bacterium]